MKSVAGFKIFYTPWLTFFQICQFMKFGMPFVQFTVIVHKQRTFMPVSGGLALHVGKPGGKVPPRRFKVPRNQRCARYFWIGCRLLRREADAIDRVL